MIFHQDSGKVNITIKVNRGGIKWLNPLALSRKENYEKRNHCNKRRLEILFGF